MTTSNNWEKEFDEKFDGNPYIQRDGTIEYSARHKLIKSLISSLLQAQRREWVESIERMETHYPEDLFSPPWKGWEKDIDELAKSHGSRIDNVSAWYARWVQGNIKKDIIALLQE